MQKALHSYLRKKPQFALIGEPLTVEHFKYLTEHDMTQYIANDQKNPDWFFNSGDYSAATDNLNINATKAIFETALQRINGEDHTQNIDMANLLRHVLYEQVLEYPVSQRDMDKFGLNPVRQTNGQLMGSPLSFPVLCIANLLTYWMALETYCEGRDKDEGVKYKKGKKRRIKIKDLAVLVNGDDILFVSNRALQTLWEAKAADFGFELSPGKSLVHPYLATVNSQQWRFSCLDRSTPRHGTWKYTPYFMTGLICEGSAAKVKSDSPVHDLAAAWNKAKTTAFSEAHALVRYLSIHRDEIRQQTQNGLLNLFASPQNGGLGFELPVCDDAWDCKFTRVQRAIAYSRNVRHLGKVVERKPDLAKIEMKFKDQMGNKLDYEYPNCNGNNKSCLYFVTTVVPTPVLQVPELCESKEEYDEEDLRDEDDEHRIKQLLAYDDHCLSKNPFFLFPFPDGYAPILDDDPDLVSVNTSLVRDRVFTDGGGYLEPKKVWRAPKLKSLRRLLRRTNTWRDSEMATAQQMKETYSYVPVVRMDLWPVNVGDLSLIIQNAFQEIDPPSIPQILQETQIIT